VDEAAAGGFEDPVEGGLGGGLDFIWLGEGGACID
jgi:hypothetical protein